MGGDTTPAFAAPAPSPPSGGSSASLRRTVQLQGVPVEVQIFVAGRAAGTVAAAVPPAEAALPSSSPLPLPLVIISSGFLVSASAYTSYARHFADSGCVLS